MTKLYKKKEAAHKKFLPIHLTAAANFDAHEEGKKAPKHDRIRWLKIKPRLAHSCDEDEPRESSFNPKDLSNFESCSSMGTTKSNTSHRKVSPLFAVRKTTC